jgi:Dyp-type peroxidase family
MSPSATRRPAVAIEWNDIQGNVLRGYGFDHGRHLVLAVDDPGRARRWLSATLPAVTTAVPWDRRPVTTLNVAFTHRGLGALGVPAGALAQLPAELRQGMRARAREHLGDVGPDDPAGWCPTGPHLPAAHVLVMVHASSAADCDEAVARIGRESSSGGLALLHTERLANLAGPDGFGAARRVEHFGFADGIVQPAVEGAMAPTMVRGNGTYLGKGRWRPVPAGEFVFGYPDDDDDDPPLPGPAWLVRNGTFLVWRKLAQDVAAFRRLVLEHGTDHPGGADLLAAQLVGRWPDGTPFADELPDDGPLSGPACPLSSHIRRANPRHALTVAPELVSRHRMLRRGMPYGPPLAPGLLDDDGADRGLLFVACCADIRRQFELVQREWLNDGNAFGVGHAPDPIAGQGDAPRCFAVPGTGNRNGGPGVDARLIGGLPRLVRTIAGEYLFQPGLQALRQLADADPP